MSLNRAQLEAVEHVTGPLLVLAGAGSGKTRVITQRIARLVERGIAPEAIVALTFTNKAAGEMQERLHALLRGGGPRSSQGSSPPKPPARKTPGKRRGVVVSTFHSFGLDVLGSERRAAGQAFTIFDQGDAIGAVKEILRGVADGRKYDASAILTRISNAKNAFLSPSDLPAPRDEYDEITCEVYPRYLAALKSFSAYDFDDLVCEVAHLWKARPDVLARWRERCQFLLVDEYQDTNRAQLEVLRLLAGERKNVCVVGDDDQSIYAWRGADIQNILDFELHFPGAKVVKLEENYRSRNPIIQVANTVIAVKTDGRRHRKTLFTSRGGEERVKVGAFGTPEEEASFVAKEVLRQVHENKRSPSEIAVLYRSNNQSKPIEEALRENGVAYRMIGGQQFFERKEVKDILSYLKLAMNRDDEISLRRIINVPTRGIGETSVERLAQHALARGWTLWQAVERVDALDDIPAAAREGCKKLERVLGGVRKRILVDRSDPAETARALCEEIGFRKDSESATGGGSASARKWSNVEGLFATLAKRSKTEDGEAKDPIEGLAAFLHALTLKFEDADEAPQKAVTLSTLHGSKGLEFDVVLLVGCEEGYLPHSRTQETRATDVMASSDGPEAGGDVEEERRLFYVGITRAKEELFLTRCTLRPMRGKPVPRTPSRFLDTVPEAYSEPLKVRPEKALGVREMASNGAALLAMLDSLGK